MLVIIFQVIKRSIKNNSSRNLMSNYSVLGIMLDVLLSQHFSEEGTVFNSHSTDDEAEAWRDK